MRRRRHRCGIGRLLPLFAALGLFLLLSLRRQAARIVRGERGRPRREQWRPIASGFLAATALTLHFVTSMTSTRLTSVAVSTALIAAQPSGRPSSPPPRASTRPA